jgi:hypothetical protein
VTKVVTIAEVGGQWEAQVNAGAPLPAGGFHEAAMSIEIDDEGRAWFFRTRTCDEPPDVPVHQVLRWALEQLHFGCSRIDLNEKGEPTTLVLGQAAAVVPDHPGTETAIKHHESREMALNLASLFAGSREAGVEPKHAELAEHLRFSANEAGYMNTEIHYAFELLEVLARIRKSTFVFSSPPIKGVLSESTSRLLREATRAYLFNLNRSCVCLCRSLLEAALQDRVDRAAVREEIARTQKGELESLINLASRTGTLPVDELGRAHSVRKTGNGAVHGDEPSDDVAWGVLLDTRRIVERIAQAA